ncbi:MAG: phosphatase [Chitinophagales bacterium]|nr:phosphatase [Chitinophagales bacterium]
MNPYRAILDLGTNTFHLLIVSVSASSFEVVYKAEEFVKLGEDGLDKIGPSPFRRGLAQLKKYKQVIDRYNPDRIVAVGTAAIRKAINGDEFIEAAKSICPMDFRKISGDEEAGLIYLGVKQAVQMNHETSLLMDIGGGSTEFILANSESIFWKQSFPLGASELKQRFHTTEPITEKEVKHIIAYLEKELRPLTTAASRFNVIQLIGASGSFDSIASMISTNIAPKIFRTNPSFGIDVDQFYKIYKDLLSKDLAERKKIKGLIVFRAEMMVVAAILIQYVIEKLNITKIMQSDYALKEGILYTMLQSNDGYYKNKHG